MGSGKPKIIHLQENKVDVQVKIRRFMRKNGINFDYIPASWLAEPRIKNSRQQRNSA